MISILSDDLSSLVNPSHPHSAGSRQVSGRNLYIADTTVDFDALFEAALEAGADDVAEEDEQPRAGECPAHDSRIERVEMGEGDKIGG